jgi:regulator of sirC expression with transglutaminase-like and TPR domain
MTREDAEALLTEAGLVADDAFPLFEAALACAVHDDPDRDADAARAVADEGVARLAARLETESPEEAIAESMAGDLRLQGDLMTYDHPDNADVIAVAERRKGIPVSIGVFYLHAARRCELEVRGVDFPGHFLLLPSELSRRALRAGLTPDVAGRLEVLMAPMSDRAVLIRLQNNIFARAQAAKDWPRAERSALRRALLNPSDHRPWLDVAAAREGQGALAGALQALGQAQILDGGAALAARAARERVRLRLN